MEDINISIENPQINIAVELEQQPSIDLTVENVNNNIDVTIEEGSPIGITIEDVTPQIAITLDTNYTLPKATAETLGGVKIGTGISVSAEGTISADAQEQVNADWDATEGVAEILNKPDLSAYLPNSHLTDFAHSDIAHTNRSALDLVSGTNTGDQSLVDYAKLADVLTLDQTTPQELTVQQGETILNIKDGDGSYFNVNTLEVGSLAIGTGAGENVTPAYIGLQMKNILIGYNSGKDSTLSGNTCIGFDSGTGSSSIGSTMIGIQAGALSSDCESCIMLGDSAGSQMSGTGATVCIGASSGLYTSGSDYSVMIGANAGSFSTDMYSSLSIGDSAGYSTSNNSYTTNIGNYAGSNSFDSASMLAIGLYAGANTNINNATIFIGSYAGEGSSNSSNITCLGVLSGRNAYQCSMALFVGSSAGENATDCIEGVYFGGAAGMDASNCDGAVFLGGQAGRESVSSSQAIFIGVAAGYASEKQINSIFIGSLAGYGDISTNTNVDFGAYNICIGASSSTGGFDNCLSLGAGVKNSENKQVNIFNGLYLKNTDTTPEFQSSDPTGYVRMGLATNAPTETLSILGTNGFFAGTQTFTGTGVNDLTISDVYNSNAGATYRVTISGVNAIREHIKYAAGSGYTVGQTFTVTQTGATLATGRVLTIIGTGATGGVDTYELTFTGAKYTTGIKNTVRTSGTIGAGFRITVNSLSDRYTWAVDGVAQGTDIQFPDGLPVTPLSNGVTLTFGSYVDHILNAYWERSYTEGNLDLLGIRKQDGSEGLFIDSDGNVGIGTETPNSKLQVVGSLTLPYLAITASRTLDATDYTVDCTANTFTVTLPTAVGYTGRVYNVKNSGTGVITVATTSSQTIDGVTTQAVYTKESLQVQSDGANWIIL